MRSRVKRWSSDGGVGYWVVCGGVAAAVVSLRNDCGTDQMMGVPLGNDVAAPGGV